MEKKNNYIKKHPAFLENKINYIKKHNVRRVSYTRRRGPSP
jgi:hypothetical protein